MNNVSRLNLKKIFLSLSNVIISVSFFFLFRRLLIRILLNIPVGKGATIHRNVKFFDIGKLTVGVGSTVNYGCYLDNRGGLEIQNNVNVSHDVKIYTMGHDINDPNASLISRSVKLCDNSWLFPNVIVMPGVTIGKGSAIYPGSVVTKSVPEYEIWGGNPARFIKKRNARIEYLASFPIWLGL